MWHTWLIYCMLNSSTSKIHFSVAMHFCRSKFSCWKHFCFHYSWHDFLNFQSEMQCKRNRAPHLSLYFFYYKCDDSVGDFLKCWQNFILLSFLVCKNAIYYSTLTCILGSAVHWEHNSFWTLIVTHIQCV